MIISEVARELSEQNGVVVRPRDVSNLFYRRQLPDDLCPVVRGRRLVPRDCVPVIEAALRERGVIPSDTGAVAAWPTP